VLDKYLGRRAARRPLRALDVGCGTGTMIGYLAQHALGRYDLPLPTSDEQKWYERLWNH